MSGRVGVGEQDIFVLVGTGGKDGSAPVDLGGIEQVEDAKVLDGKKAATFFQLDRRIAMMIELQVASQMPLVQDQ